MSSRGSKSYVNATCLVTFIVRVNYKSWASCSMNTINTMQNLTQSMHSMQHRSVNRKIQRQF